jgi:RNA-directed DNA polymerase
VRKPRLLGPAFLIRYVDDAVIVGSNEHDAGRVMDVLSQRLDRFALTLHPEKTGPVDFRRPRHRPGNGGAFPPPETFDFLGMTHMWATTRKKRWGVKRKTATDRFSRALKKVAQWCRRNRHMSIPEQHKALSLKLRGHYNYYGVIGNLSSVWRFYWRVIETWRRWLLRRSNRSSVWWSWMRSILKRHPLPLPSCTRPVVST